MTNQPKFSGYFQAFLAALMTFTCGMSYGAYSLLIVPLSERLGHGGDLCLLPGGSVRRRNPD